MSCNNPQTVTQTIICAKACTVKFNEEPVAKFFYEDFILSDDSQYFDKGSVAQRQVRWQIYTGDYLVYDFGFGNYFEEIPELTNGSVYSVLSLGLQNQDMLDFITSLPDTLIPDETKFTIYIEVKDNTGIKSTNLSNKYCFS